MNLVYLLLSLLLITPTFLPIGSIFGTGLEREQEISALLWFYGILTIFLLAALATYFSGKSQISPVKFFQKFFTVTRYKYFITIFFVATILLVIISSGVFQGRPIFIDSVAQYFQAKIFASGAVKAFLPKNAEFFYSPNLIYENTFVYSQYAPFHSLLLAAGLLLASPSLVVIFISLAGIYFASCFYRQVLGVIEANIAMALLATCPFYLFLGASFMNHATVFLLTAIFVFQATKFIKLPCWQSLFFAGICLGLALATRSLDIIAISLCYLVWIIKSSNYRTRPAMLIAILLGILPGISFYLYYNYSTTGDPFLTGFTKLWGVGHQLGFHLNPWGISYGAREAVQNFLIDWKLINQFLLESSVPALLFIPVLFFRKKINLWDSRLLILAIAPTLAYLFYWHRDALLGPRYLYCSVLFLVPLIVRAGSSLLASAKDKYLKIGQVACAWSSFWIYFFVLALAYALSFGFTHRYQEYAQSMSTFKVDLPSALKNQKIDRALVFIPVSLGHRLISKLRGAGVAASLVEQVYRHSDHCELLNVVNRFEAEKLSPEQLSGLLSQLLLKETKLQKINLTGDGSFRLRVGNTISPNCQQELDYDLSGDFSSFTAHLIDNQIDFKGNYVFATDLRGHNQALIADYPNYPVYLYRNGQFNLIN